MLIFDTHCHYNLEPLYSGQAFCFKVKEKDPILQMHWQNHWQKSKKEGIAKSIVVGPGIKSSKKAIEIAEAETNLYAAVGIHPERANKINDIQNALEELAILAKSKKVVAIGETGLDCFYLNSENPDKILQIKQKQKELFVGQINLANELNLPLILHVRDKTEEAYLETLEIIEQYWQFKKSLIFHCVSGPEIYIKKALNLNNSYFGFDGNLTFKKADDIRAIFSLVQKTDSSKILLETDAPYLAPEPYRGQICEPWMIKEIAVYAKDKLGANLKTIYQNSLNAFNIN